MTDVQTLVEQLIEREGGYVDHPNDKGGPTRYGITEQVARAYGYAGVMRSLPRSVAVTIYIRRYWTGVRFDQAAAVYPRVGAELFDTGVNMGQSVAAGFLQRALNGLNRGAIDYPDMNVDGAIGPMTIAALKAFAAKRGARGELVLLKALDGLQAARYIELVEGRPANEDFLFGWLDSRIGQAA